MEEEISKSKIEIASYKEGIKNASSDENRANLQKLLEIEQANLRELLISSKCIEFYYD